MTTTKKINQQQPVLAPELKVQEKSNEKNQKSWKPLRQPGGTYFYSSVIAGKKNVFVTPEYMDLLINAFKMVEIKQDIKNLAYIVMPNHFLWVFRLSEKQDDPVKIYAAVKKEVTLAILKNLSQEAKDENEQFEMLDLFKTNEKVNRSHPRRILWQFKQEAKKLDNGKKFQVWQPKGKIYLLDDDERLNRNLKFIQEAPVRDRWQLVEKAEEYPYLFMSEEALEKIKV